ncbi:MAG: molybdopterin converting factor subunit 1 [Oceanospirillaceae bacterium]|nr:molybdopterin converting factor subunit 1 [Oceanospirillaceae bacterium]MCP5349703.1 molybdopterin converting factor subunit 1 [Oceanospirillaceae bacterium]
MIQVLFFASLREKLNCAGMPLNIQSPCRARDVLQQLIRQHPEWENALNGPRLLVAINQEMSQPDDAVQDGDEVAFYPPVTGG